MATRASRAKKPTSYALDTDATAAAADTAPSSSVPADEDSDPSPDSAASDDDDSDDSEAYTDDEDDDAYASDDDDASDGGGGAPPRRKRKARSGNAARIHKPHVFRVNRVTGAPPGLRRRNRPAAAGAADVPGALRPPDPSVKITYRPGFIKSTGKRERIITTYGQNNETLVKAIGVRDEYIGLPAVPERRGLRVTPFWRGGEVRAVEVGEQRVESVQEGGREKYLPDVPEGVLKCIAVVLNAGGHVTGMEWAPDRSKGSQYLLLSTKHDSTFAPSPPPPRPPTAARETPPAFERAPGPSCIQVWRFPTDATGTTSSAPPNLQLALCHDWGYASCLKFHQAPRENADERDLGLLAAVFRDGNIRVIQVRLPEQTAEEEEAGGATAFVKVTVPAYTLSLDATLCTTLTWLTPHSLIAGCSNGFLAAWDLTRHPGTPYLYTPIHQTYIAAIASCFPSFPTHVVTASLDGYCRITSLLDPYTDTVVNNRSRIAPTSICWVDAVSAAVSSEEGAWVKFYPLRRFFSATTVCKHSGVVNAVAGSAVHAFLVSGGSEGECAFSNPVRRTFHGKIKNYQQTWFQLEYARKSNMFRMSEGFKLEEFETKSEKLKRRQNNTALVHSTAYPEQSNITQVCWNQNLVAGGWAAAGMACGLVRVEDVAIDD
ncbi:uncharacterized protein H6S33_005673 [Morchella sextelata]|uniref:uncharacterized protein n=1 Tax=Morchella sextelata TaxID=1174677 RepID=UPI001D03AD1F|nr:uncharacterized protein H6S33_005673 [Morchella sextelata]KAH0613787.1 hypothetical protein H6S33_005673 [Morchella sextelata]